jgi:hypothetical protein
LGGQSASACSARGRNESFVQPFFGFMGIVRGSRHGASVSTRGRSRGISFTSWRRYAFRGIRRHSNLRCRCEASPYPGLPSTHRGCRRGSKSRRRPCSERAGGFRRIAHERLVCASRVDSVAGATFLAGGAARNPSWYLATFVDGPHLSVGCEAAQIGNVLFPGRNCCGAWVAGAGELKSAASAAGIDRKERESPFPFLVAAGQGLHFPRGPDSI